MPVVAAVDASNAQLRVVGVRLRLDIVEKGSQHRFTRPPFVVALLGELLYEAGHIQRPAIPRFGFQLIGKTANSLLHRFALLAASADRIRKREQGVCNETTEVLLHPSLLDSNGGEIREQADRFHVRWGK